MRELDAWERLRVFSPEKSRSQATDLVDTRRALARLEVGGEETAKRWPRDIRVRICVWAIRILLVA